MTQDEFDKGHKMLDGLIALTTRGRNDCCNARDAANRSRFDDIIGHLHHVRAIAGQLDPEGIEMRFGGK